MDFQVGGYVVGFVCLAGVCFLVLIMGVWLSGGLVLVVGLRPGGAVARCCLWFWGWFRCWLLCVALLVLVFVWIVTIRFCLMSGGLAWRVVCERVSCAFSSYCGFVVWCRLILIAGSM